MKLANSSSKLREGEYYSLNTTGNPFCYLGQHDGNHVFVNQNVERREGFLKLIEIPLNKLKVGDFGRLASSEGRFATFNLLDFFARENQGLLEDRIGYVRAMIIKVYGVKE